MKSRRNDEPGEITQCIHALRPAGRTKVRSNRLSCRFSRTPDQSVRSRLLYPTELRALIWFAYCT